MLIPRVIHKIVINESCTLPKLPDGISSSFESFYRLNPDYKVKLYSGEDLLNI